MKILGISAFYHDSAAAVIENGHLLAAAQEERFTRKKHDSSFPVNAINYCLQFTGWTIDDVDYIAFYDKPFLKFERLLETYLAFAPHGFQSFRVAIPIWVKEKLFQKKIIKDKLDSLKPTANLYEKMLFAEHHQSHAASAFYPSPFSEAVILTMDGVGEWATTSVYLGRGNQLELVKEINFPHSLGLLYSAFTYYTGFKVNSGEYKLMGLAPYGEAKYYEVIKENLIDIKKDGSFRLNMDYFNYCVGLTMTSKKFDALFGSPPRKPEELLTQKHMDIAASIQKVTEEVILKITQTLSHEMGQKNLCLAGGVALNCVANGKIVKAGHFSNVWLQPAAGDAGGSVGAAFAAYFHHLEQPRLPLPQKSQDTMQGSYLGPSYSAQEIKEQLTELGAKFEVMEEEVLLDTTAESLANGYAVGWFQGRMEFGPRALGNRSILGDPRSSSMQKNLNLKVKYRESFRPFAPSVLREDVSDWFELDADSPYMLLVADVHLQRHKKMTAEEAALFGIDKLNVARSDIPAVTHVDYSARIQTVHQDINPIYHKLINKFKEKTGCPILVNTSFNVRGEPIVCTPQDAFRCFMGTEIERLVIGNCYLEKEKQDESLMLDYKSEFELD